MTQHEKIREIVKIEDQAPLALDAGRSALIVVDVQRYFANFFTAAAKAAV